MIITAHEAHFGLITRAISDVGRAELADVYGMTPEETLRRNFAASTEAWTMFAGIEALAMFGVAPLDVMSGTGEFWIVGTTHICRHRFAFSRMCRKFLPQLLGNWSELHGLLEHGRPDVLKWAQWMGVEVSPMNERLSHMTLKGN